VIQLDRGANGTVDAVTATDSGGRYWFSDLEAGTYRVCEVLQPGWEATYPNTASGCHDVVIDPPNGVRVHGDSGVAEMPNFGNFIAESAGIVLGTKFSDVNGDGVKGAGELPLMGWTVRAYRDVNANGTLDPEDVLAGVKAEDVTDATGSYILELPETGSYIVLEVIALPWIQTAPDVIRNTIEPTLGRFGYSVTVPPSGIRLVGLDFGNRRDASKRRFLSSSG
jgi:hypothetical protein